MYWLTFLSSAVSRGCNRKVHYNPLTKEVLHVRGHILIRRDRCTISQLRVNAPGIDFSWAYRHNRTPVIIS